MFTVETGAGVSNSNSYATVAQADTFHTERGNTGWTGDDATKQTALIRATDYLTQVYTESWIGDKTDQNQSLDWPRAGIYNLAANTIPKALIQATCILALEALTQDLNPTLGRAVKKEKVDVIEVEYMDSASPTSTRPAIDGLLSKYLSGSRFMVPAVRR